MKQNLLKNLLILLTLASNSTLTFAEHSNPSNTVPGRPRVEGGNAAPYDYTVIKDGAPIANLFMSTSPALKKCFAELKNRQVDIRRIEQHKFSDQLTAYRLFGVIPEALAGSNEVVLSISAERIPGNTFPEYALVSSCRLLDRNFKILFEADDNKITPYK